MFKNDCMVLLFCCCILISSSTLCQTPNKHTGDRAFESKLLLFRLYKTIFSANDIPHVCMFHPSCSVFAAHAFKKYHIPKALWLTTDRLMRCNGRQAHALYPYNSDVLKFEDPIENYE